MANGFGYFRARGPGHSQSKKEQIARELAEEKAKRDAGYEYGEDSIEPVARGAFTGAISSGLLSRIIRPSTRVGEGLVIGAGTLGGAILGHFYNNKKVKQARAARQWLADHRAQREYGAKTRSLFKGAGVRLPGGSDFVSQSTDMIPHPHRKKENKAWSLAKDTAINAGLGAALYGGFRALKHPLTMGTPHNKKEIFTSAIKGAGLFGATIPTSQAVYDLFRKEGGKNRDQAGTFAAYGIGAGMVEPLIMRAYGRHFATKSQVDKALENMKHSKYTVPIEEESIVHGFRSRGPNSSTKFWSGLGGATKTKVIRNGLAGLATGYVIDQAMKHFKKNKKQ